MHSPHVIPLITNYLGPVQHLKLLWLPYITSTWRHHTRRILSTYIIAQTYFLSPLVCYQCLTPCTTFPDVLTEPPAKALPPPSDNAASDFHQSDSPEPPFVPEHASISEDDHDSSPPVITPPSIVINQTQRCRLFMTVLLCLKMITPIVVHPPLWLWAAPELFCPLVAHMKSRPPPTSWTLSPWHSWLPTMVWAIPYVFILLSISFAIN